MPSDTQTQNLFIQDNLIHLEKSSISSGNQIYTYFPIFVIEKLMSIMTSDMMIA
jgi:hypothetical protein